MKARHPRVSSRHQGRVLAKRAKSPARASTYRLDPRFQRGLALLGTITKTPANRMVNEAVGEYLEARAAEVEADLEETLRRVKAYLHADPDHESAIASFVEAEASLAGVDPVEGETASAPGPVQRLVRNLIRG